MRKATLDNLIKALASATNLYLPVDTAAGAMFTKYEDGMVMSEKLNTVRSPKDLFFPQTENLMQFKVEGKSIEIIDTRAEAEDFAIFGVRACDAKGLEVLDKVFLAEPVDTYYQNRREHGVIITVACNKPVETCFCHTFGVDAANPAGDISCWDTEDGYVLKANTEKGEKLLEKLGLEETCDCAADAQKAVITERLNKLPLKDLSVEGLGAGTTDKFFNHPIWDKIYEPCLGCGTCTFVCPTCQCYDIKDYDTGHGIQRFRCWDSCMYTDFTKMSAGQPRLTQKERFRQRFMHKLVYFPTNNDGMFSCVGCGRCVGKCPVKMNIVKVIKELGGNK